MKNKIKKFNKTSQDYKAKKIGIISCCMAIASVGILIPAAEQYKKENLALNQQIELLLNDDVQDVQIEEIDEVDEFKGKHKLPKLVQEVI